MIDAFLEGLFPLALASHLLIWAALIFFGAGLVKGMLGIGFPTASISLLAQITDARTAIGLVILPMIVTNAWQIWRSRQVRWVLSTYWRLLLYTVLFIGLTTFIASMVPLAAITVALGMVVFTYAASSLYKPTLKISDSQDKSAQLVSGISSGVMGGLAGMWAPPILIYLNARGVSKEQFVATSGVLLFCGSVVLFLGYWRAELLGLAVLLMSVLMLIPAMLGMLAGENLRRNMTSKRFERLLLWFFLIMGLNLIRRGLL